jgi:CheY-like chemotaxis protein
MSSLAIVDNNRVTARSMAQCLSRAGFNEVVCLDQASQALDARLLGAVDLWVIDWRMPGFDGIELIRRIAGRATARASLVLVSGATKMGADVVHEALSAGAAAVFRREEAFRQFPAWVQRLRQKPAVAMAPTRSFVPLVPRQILANGIGRVAPSGEERRLVQALLDLAVQVDPERVRQLVDLGGVVRVVAGRYGLPDGAAEQVELSVRLLAVQVLLEAAPRGGSLRPAGENLACRALARLPTPLGPLAVQLLEHWDAHWDGSGVPRAASGAGIPVASRLLSVARAVQATSPEDARRRSLPAVREGLDALAGHSLDPQMVARILRSPRRASTGSWVEQPA